MNSTVSAGRVALAQKGLFGRLGARLLRASGRRHGAGIRHADWVEMLEQRMMLDGVDHPSFPTPFNPSIGTVVALTVNPGFKNDGRGTSEGNIASSSGDDTFRFTMPGAMGTTDFVSVLVDTVMRADNATPWGSTLDSYVEVYNASGTLISSGANNGIISATAPNPSPDGWTGFIGTAGQTYTIRVRSEQGALAAGRTRTGNYTLRIDAATQAINIDTAFDADPDKGADTFGDGQIGDNIDFRQDEIVYKVVVPNDARFNSLATASAIAENIAALDTHLSVYDAQAQQLADDQQAGRLTNAFSSFTGASNTTTYFRVRSDEIASGRPAFGQFTLVVDMSALPLTIDQVTRVNATRRDPLIGPTMNTPGTAAKIYQFRTEGTGLAIITVKGNASAEVMLGPLSDPAVRIFDGNGNQIAFNDDFAGTTDAQLEVVLTGGETYYILVEAFDVAANGGFAVNIEAHHTFGPTVPVDDHVNGDDVNFINYENATPIIWDQPTRFTNSDGNVIDHSWVQSGVARGRIHTAGDTDLFQFTPPVSMLGSYAGNDGDQGAALYMGGTFAQANYSGSASGQHSIDAHNSVIWDAGRFYKDGAALEMDGAIDGTIRSMVAWDIDGAGGNPPLLVAGGDFNMLDDMGNSVDTNLAIRVYIPFDPMDPTSVRYQWFPLEITGEVFTMITGDLLDGAIVADELFVGGSITNVGGAAVNNVFAVQFTGNGFAVNNLGGGVTGGATPSVKALALWDPPDAPDPDMAGPAPDPADQPLGLYVGGAFTNAPGAAGVNNIARFGRIDTMVGTPNTWQGLGTVGYNGGALGFTGITEITAIQPYDPPVQGGGVDPGVRLFVSARNGANGLLRTWNPAGAAATPPEAVWSANINYGATTPIFTMTTWVPPMEVNPDNTQFLVLGGGDATSGFVNIGVGAAFAQIGTDVDGAVRDLVAFTDVEPAFVSDGASVLYAVGDFLNVNTAPAPTLVNHAIKLDFGAIGDGDWVPLGAGAGVEGMSPGGTAPTINTIAVFDDDIGTANPVADQPSVWDRMERPSGRVAITVAPTTDAFLQTVIRVFDSNLNLIYTNDRLALPDDARSGAIDPGAPDGGFINVSPPLNLNAAPGFTVWGGEVYYIEVSGAGTGRYTVQVTTDAVPPEDMDNGDGAYQDEISAFFEVSDGTLPDSANTPVLLDPARAGAATEIQIAADGRARTFLDPTNAANPSAYTVRAYDTTPAGIDRVTFSELPVIERVGDTDLYKFRAQASGYAEIRMATFGLISGFQQIVTDIDGQQTSTTLEKTINSPLDGALRIFNNDFEQLAYNDDQFTSSGYLSEYFIDGDDGPQLPNGNGTFDPDTRVFRHRDPRVVIPVVAGESYFIQVESGQLLTSLNADPAISSLVDWRHATGAYEVLLSMTPSLNGIDDHSNAFVAATPMPIIDSTGDGTVTGIIDDVITGVFQNPDDRDIFRYVAPNRGQTIVRLVPTGVNNLLRANVQIFSSATGLPVAQTVAAPGATAQLSFFPEQGEEFFFVINGDAGSEGAYRLEVNGPGITDDHASERNWADATPLALVPFFGTATATGVIENPDDWDVFKFTSETYETASVTVDSMSITLDPFVQVYEISSDLDDSTMGNPVLLQISFNNDGPNLGTDSRATFSTTPGRTYYIVVSGLNPGTDFGNYQVQVQVAPTDDHPNFVNFPQATAISLTFNPLTQTATNTPPTNGNIEKNVDDDMFRFTAPATGLAMVTINTPDSLFAPAVRIFDQTGTEIIALTDGTNGSVSVTIPSIVQNQQYYIQVRPGTTGAMEPDDIGTYTVTVSTEPIDDHPDEGDFAGIVNPRDTITLNNSNGVGSNMGTLVPDGDTDLFRFSTLAAGSTLVRITTTNSSLNPKFRIFNSSFVLIPGATSNGDTATQTITAGGTGEVYYILVEKNTGATGAAAVGNYQVSVSGQIPGGGGGGGGDDDHANAGEFNDATAIIPNSRTGYGSDTGVIDFVGDTDLFSFTALGNGAVSIQIVTPSGGLVDGAVRIFNQSFVQIANNAAGIPGATAAVNFTGVLGQTYYILVEPVGSAQGSYEVRVDSQPLEYFLYYPEGFSTRRIDEFVPIVNPNSFPVTYSLYARYETGANDDVPIWTSTIAANSRSGVTITTRKNFAAALVRPNTPYSLELRSDGPLGATFSHYDFNVSVGENFSKNTSTIWTLSNVNKSPAEFRDYLVFYNPNNTAANLTITLYYTNGFTTSFTQQVPAGRRSGININNDGRVPQQGRFGVKIESDLGIVAAQSSYNLLNSGGDGLLGDRNGGAIEGVIPGVSTGGGVTSRLAILNTHNQPVTVTVTASYARVDLPDLTRIIVIQPGRTFSQTLQAFGLTNSEVAGLRYTSTLPVTASVIQYQNGDGDATAAATEAATRFLFGDAFMNPRRAGITYIENLSLFNPGTSSMDITLTFLFPDGTSQSTSVNVGGGDFAFISIDQQPIILSMPRSQGFSMSIAAANPFVASFTHYDRFLNGGWGTLGFPVGLTNELSTI